MNILKKLGEVQYALFRGGCAGFIGSNIVDRLLADIRASAGQEEFIAPAINTTFPKGMS